MKLYLSRGACSLAPHIVLEELGIPYDKVALDFNRGDHKTPEFLAVNPMGAVPVLVLPSGEALTEVAAILTYLGDLNPELRLAPPPGDPRRIRLHEWLSLISSELHKGLGLFFSITDMTPDPEAQQSIRAWATEQVAFRLDAIEGKIQGRNFLLGDEYSVADAYFLTVLNWTRALKFDLSRWPAVVALLQRIKERPATRRAFEAEKLRLG